MERKDTKRKDKNTKGENTPRGGESYSNRSSGVGGGGGSALSAPSPPHSCTSPSDFPEGAQSSEEEDKNDEKLESDEEEEEEDVREEDLLYIQLCQVLQEHIQALENFASGKTKNLLDLFAKEESAIRSVYVEKLRVCSQQYSIVLGKSTTTSSQQKGKHRCGNGGPAGFTSPFPSVTQVEAFSAQYLQRFGSYIDTNLPFLQHHEEEGCCAQGLHAQKQAGGAEGRRHGASLYGSNGKDSFDTMREIEGGQWLTLHCAAAGDALGSQYTDEIYHSLDPYSGYSPIRTSCISLMCGSEGNPPLPGAATTAALPPPPPHGCTSSSSSSPPASTTTSTSSRSRGKGEHPPASSELLRMFLHDPHMSHVAVLVPKFITRCRPFLTDRQSPKTFSCLPPSSHTTMATAGASSAGTAVPNSNPNPSGGGGATTAATAMSSSSSIEGGCGTEISLCLPSSSSCIPSELPSFIHPKVSFLTPSAWTLVRYLLHPKDQLRYIGNGFHICGLSATPCLLLLTNVRLVLLPFSRLTQRGDVVLCAHDGEGNAHTMHGSSSSSCSCVGHCCCSPPFSPAARGGEGRLKSRDSAGGEGHSGGKAVQDSSPLWDVPPVATPPLQSHKGGSGGGGGGFSLAAVTRHLHRFLTEEVRGGGFSGGAGGGGGGSGKEKKAKEQQEKEEHRIQRDGAKVAQAMRQITRHSYRQFYWSYLLSSLRRVHCLRYMHLETAVHLEFHLGDGPMLALMDPHASMNPNVRAAFIAALKDVLEDPLCFANAMDVEFNEATSRSSQLRSMLMRWATGTLSNYDYISFLNACACRTLKDYSQYPVFPWVIADYTSSTLRLDQKETYRQLEYPIGAQTESRRAQLREHYEQSKELAMDAAAAWKPCPVSSFSSGTMSPSPSFSDAGSQSGHDATKGASSPRTSGLRTGGDGVGEVGSVNTGGTAATTMCTTAPGAPTASSTSFPLTKTSSLSPSAAAGGGSSHNVNTAVVATPPVVHPFHHGVHYSTSGGVLYYLVRCEPFTTFSRQYHGGHFDNPNRLFFSMAETYHSCVSVSTDNKELLPMFYGTMGDFLYNNDRLDLGIREGEGGGAAAAPGKRVDHVELPPWTRGSVQVFMAVMRYALESDYVRLHLHEWVDLVFGSRRRGPLAVESCNVFQRMTYGEEVLEALRHANSPQECDLIIAEVDCFGQAPRQLFTERHPSYLELAPKNTQESLRRYLSSHTSFSSSASGKSGAGNSSGGGAGVSGSGVSGSSTGGSGSGNSTNNTGGGSGSSNSSGGGGSSRPSNGSGIGQKLTYQQAFDRESPRVLDMIFYSLGDDPSPYSIMVDLLDENRSASEASTIPSSSQPQSFGPMTMECSSFANSGGGSGANWEESGAGVGTTPVAASAAASHTSARATQAGGGNASMISVRPPVWPSSWSCTHVSFLRHLPHTLRCCFAGSPAYGYYSSQSIVGFSLYRSCGRKQSDCCYPSHPFSSIPAGQSSSYGDWEKGGGGGGKGSAGVGMSNNASGGGGGSSKNSTTATGGGNKKNSSCYSSSTLSSTASTATTPHRHAIHTTGNTTTSSTSTNTSTAFPATTASASSSSYNSGGGGGLGSDGGGLASSRLLSSSTPFTTSSASRGGMNTTPVMNAMPGALGNNSMSGGMSMMTSTATITGGNVGHFTNNNNTYYHNRHLPNSGGAPPPLHEPPVGFALPPEVVFFPSLPGCTAVEGTDYYLCWHPLESSLMRFRQDDGSFISMLPFDLPNESTVRLTVVKAGYRECVIVVGTSAGNIYALFPDVHGRGPYLHSAVMRVHHAPVIHMDLDTVHGKLLTITGSTNGEDEPVLWRISHCHLSLLVRLPVRQVIQTIRRRNRQRTGTRKTPGEVGKKPPPLTGAAATATTTLKMCEDEMMPKERRSKGREVPAQLLSPFSQSQEGGRPEDGKECAMNEEEDKKKLVKTEDNEEDEEEEEEEEEEDIVVQYGCLDKRQGLVILLTRKYILYFDHAGRPYGCGCLPTSSASSYQAPHPSQSSMSANYPGKGEGSSSDGEREPALHYFSTPGSGGGTSSTSTSISSGKTLLDAPPPSSPSCGLAPMNVLTVYDTTEWVRGIQLLIVGHVDGTLSLWRVTRTPPAAVQEGEIVLIQYHTTIKERPSRLREWPRHPPRNTPRSSSSPPSPPPPHRSNATCAKMPSVGRVPSLVSAACLPFTEEQKSAGHSPSPSFMTGREGTMRGGEEGEGGVRRAEGGKGKVVEVEKDVRQPYLSGMKKYEDWERERNQSESGSRDGKKNERKEGGKGGDASSSIYHDHDEDDDGKGEEPQQQQQPLLHNPSGEKEKRSPPQEPSREGTLRPPSFSLPLSPPSSSSSPPRLSEEKCYPPEELKKKMKKGKIKKEKKLRTVGRGKGSVEYSGRAVTAIHQMRENIPHFLIGYENGTIRSWRFCVLESSNTTTGS